IERISANGDSHIDIELNQAVIGLDNSPPCPAPPCSFVVPTDSPPTLVGGRTINDVLINMDFSNGGKFGALVVRKWDGTQWVVAETLTSEGCTSDDLFCAVNNGSAISGTLNSGL